jgi:hypothetical protein
VNMLKPVERFDDLFILEFASQQGLCLEPSQSTSASARKAVNPSVPVPRSAVSGKSGDFTILLSDSTLFNDRGEAIIVDEICAGDIFHCPECDVVRSSGITAPDLNPSMRAFSPSRHEVMLYCFACNVLHIVRNVVDYTGFKQDAYIVESETGYLTADFVLGDIAVDNDMFSDCAGSAQNRRKNRRLVAVNSPMGSGKTEAVPEFAKRSLSNGPFLVVTYAGWEGKCLLPQCEAGSSAALAYTCFFPRCLYAGAHMRSQLNGHLPVIRHATRGSAPSRCGR